MAVRSLYPLIMGINVIEHQTCAYINLNLLIIGAEASRMVYLLTTLLGLNRTHLSSNGRKLDVQSETFKPKNTVLTV